MSQSTVWNGDLHKDTLKKKIKCIEFRPTATIDIEICPAASFIAQAPTLSAPGLNLSHNAALFIFYTQIVSTIDFLMCAL